MEIKNEKEGNWTIEHDGLIVGGISLEDVIFGYGEAMKNRGRIEATTQSTNQ